MLVSFFAIDEIVITHTIIQAANKIPVKFISVSLSQIDSTTKKLYFFLGNKLVIEKIVAINNPISKQ